MIAKTNRSRRVYNLDMQRARGAKRDKVTEGGETGGPINK
jgi:hypothetical protein